ncbi:uncharacterized protein LOC130050024 [Ostrea edulis]|uniref:uncharacterized protein LOC130050024 n=1 Tax=Ostrea edulis TaxID=37623 RepID=UPI0024AEC5BF|nr:uncharacterized protein LOC130050024 [Ostrea edulis]
MYPTQLPPALWEGRVESLLAAAVAKNTAATYRRALDSFTKFRIQYMLPALWPPSDEQIVYYLAYLSANNISHSSAKCYISGLSYQLQIQGKQDTTKVFIVKKMLEGMHRLNPSNDIRAPISPPPLLNCITLTLPSVCKNYYEATLFTLAFHLAFFALLRISELTVSHNSSLVISIQDLQFLQNQIQLTIRGSKTDQYANSLIVHIGLSNDTSHTTTLFQTLQQYLHSIPRSPVPLLLHLNGKPLTSYQFTSILRKTLQFIKVDTSTFKSYSFQIGGATYMHLLGVSEEDIKIKGRWKSSAVKSYIRVWYFIISKCLQHFIGY